MTCNYLNNKIYLYFTSVIVGIDVYLIVQIAIEG